MPRTPRRPVPRGLRVVNILAGLIFLAGAGIYTRAWFGMRALRSHQPAPDAEPFAAMARFDYFWQLSRIGVWLVLVALAVGVIAAIAAVVSSRRAASDAEDVEPETTRDQS